jgi:hypothetical protein
MAKASEGSKTTYWSRHGQSPAVKSGGNFGHFGFLISLELCCASPVTNSNKLLRLLTGFKTATEVLCDSESAAGLHTGTAGIKLLLLLVLLVPSRWELRLARVRF